MGQAERVEASGGALSRVLHEAQARQAVTVAAWLRCPTPVDAALVGLVGRPGGSGHPDRAAGADAAGDAGAQAWRTWADEAVVSWAACLPTDPDPAERAVAAVSADPHLEGLPVGFRRLVSPDEHDRRAAVLLRHPDLLAPAAGLRRATLLAALGRDRPLAAWRASGSGLRNESGPRALSGV
ncbi:hypothetical protein [Streptomyces minutiscleroticus]|uniref:hypothetical protein n=1 Tax=Streptomyces minutiscleroticus TaxID=68238 RepID=UPI00167E0872|nr:hypothetical protein [Streptomyces minutiscleroticus]